MAYGMISNECDIIRQNYESEISLFVIKTAGQNS